MQLEEGGVKTWDWVLREQVKTVLSFELKNEIRSAEI
jgi:hypothetical protein